DNLIGFLPRIDKLDYLEIRNWDVKENEKYDFIFKTKSLKFKNCKNLDNFPVKFLNHIVELDNCNIGSKEFLQFIMNPNSGLKNVIISKNKKVIMNIHYDAKKQKPHLEHLRLNDDNIDIP